MKTPTILWKDTLECDWEFMSQDIVAKKCDCNKKKVCMLLIDLLDNWKQEEAIGVIEDNFIYTKEYENTAN